MDLPILIIGLSKYDVIPQTGIYKPSILWSIGNCALLPVRKSEKKRTKIWSIFNKTSKQNLVPEVDPGFSNGGVKNVYAQRTLWPRSPSRPRDLSPPPPPIRLCAARETPIFNPKFPLRSISFSQITKIFRSGAREILHFFPFRRPSFSKFLYVQTVHRRPRPAYCSQPERSGSARPGVSARQRNYFSHRSSGPPVRTHLHTANQRRFPPPPPLTYDMNIHDLRLRNNSTHVRGLVILLRWGKEEEYVYTQDAYNQIYVQWMATSDCHTVVLCSHSEALVIDPEQLRWLEVS